MKKIEITPESLWKKYIQARPDSVERAGYGIDRFILRPEFQYEAKCGKDYCHLKVDYSGKFPDVRGVVCGIEQKITEERPEEFKSSDITKGQAHFDLIDRLREEAWERFNKTRESIPEFKEWEKVNQKYVDYILKPLLSFDKPLINSIPCAKLEIRPRSFCYDLPEDGYDKWITHLKFSEFLKKLRTPATSFPEIGDSISYSLYTKFSGNFDGVNAERGLTLKYRDSIFNFSSDEKQEESKSVNFRLDALGDMIPVKKGS